MNKKNSVQRGVQIGCIGQGWVGKNIADNFESRGFQVVRYSKDEPYNTSEARTATGLCDIVFIAVPTPTTKDGFDDRIVRSVVGLVGKGKIAVIKSTILPGVTDAIQQAYPDRYVFHVPEFLTEANVAFDVAHPWRNVVGIPAVSATNQILYKKKVEEIVDIIPSAPLLYVCSAREAELVKYASNCFLAMKVIYANTLCDIAEELQCDYEKVAEAVGSDARIGKSHLIVNKTGGRGAGGHCFIKDLAAFRGLGEKVLGKQDWGTAFLRSAEEKNIELLASTKKDIDLLLGVYGKEKVTQFKKT